MERQYEDDLVSVITPVYNAEKYLKEMLDSVFSQTYKRVEVVLVDDCSVDKSAEIIASYQKEHPEIVYCCQEKNMGAGAARNKALELARGRFVAFLDSDDIWMPDKLERQLKEMQRRNSPFCYGAIEMIDTSGKRIKPKRKIRERCDYRYLLCNTLIATSSVVIDRKVLGDFRMHVRRGGQDYATWLKLLRGGAVACGINEVLVQYRVSGNSLSSNKLDSIRQVWEIQTQDEGIGRLSAFIHVGCFGIHAIKKYLF